MTDSPTPSSPRRRESRRVSHMAPDVPSSGGAGLKIDTARRSSALSSSSPSPTSQGSSPRGDAALSRRARRTSSMRWVKSGTRDMGVPSPTAKEPPSARHAGLVEGIIWSKEGFDESDDEDRAGLSEQVEVFPFLDGLPTRKELLRATKDQSQLHDMASLGRVHDIQALIQGGADLDKPDAFGRTPMHVAAQYGHVAAVQLLAQFGAKLEQGDQDGQTPLQISLQSGQRGQGEVISALLALQADVHSVSSGGVSALHHAVRGLQPQAIEKLISMKADPEALTDQQESPVRMAVQLGHAAALDSLLASRCEVQTRDEDGASPLHLAACKQRLEIVDVLVARGARIEAYDNFGMTPVHWAARAGEHEAAAKLLQLRANVTCRTTQDRHTPLHLAVMSDELETINVLVQAKAALNAQDKRGHAPLHAAVEHIRPEALSCLLEHGADRDLQTVLDDTALHLACRRNRPQLVKILTAAGSSCNFRGRNGFTALHISADVGSMQCATTLLDPVHLGKDETVETVRARSANMRDFQSQTPLHIAAWHGRLEICQLLLAAKSEVDAFDAEKLTPLSVAVTRDHDAVVRCLLQFQADPMRRNEQELTPLQQACVSGAPTVAKSLTEMRLLPDKEEPPWRRPLALAKFYGHETLADFFSLPCPKARLALRGRAVNATTVAVTFSGIFAEPPITAVVAECVPAVAEDQSEQENLVASDPFAPRDGVEIKEVTVYQEEWSEGKTINIDGLKTDVLHWVRLVAQNDAGTTYGDHIALKPVALAVKARRGVSRQNTLGPMSPLLSP